MAWNVTITNEGLPLIAAVIMNQGTLTFTELRLSDTDYRGQEATLTEGTFGGVYLTTSATASIIDSTTIRVKGNFNGAGLTEAHEVCSLGIIATDGNDTVLLAVCTDTTPGTIEPGVGGRVSTLSFNVNLSVSSTDNITVVGTTAGVLYDIDVVDTLISNVTDKPLSANQGRLIADNLAANENVLGAKNQLDDSNCTLNNMTQSGHTFTSNATDTRYFFDFAILAYEGTTYLAVLGGAHISVPNTYEFEITIPNNANRLNIKHNGEQSDIGIFVNINVTGTWVLSIDITGADPTTVGGLSFKDIMLRPASVVDPTFAPYAETNLQLTQNKAERDDLSTIHATGSTNTTGSQINAGSLFYLNGTLCKALTNIGVNDAFTLNTNYKEDTVASELTTVETWSIAPDNYAYSTEVFEFHRVGKVVYFSGCALSDTLPVGSSTIVTSLPAKLIPVKTWNMRGMIDPLNPNDHFAISITSNGSIEVYRYTANSANTVGAFSQSGSYIANN